MMMDSLIKYADPVEIGATKDKRAQQRGAGGRSSTAEKRGSSKQLAAGTAATEEGVGGLASEILNSLIPPRQFTENGKQMIQYVSDAPAPRIEAITLQKELDRRLVERKAREVGICPVRQELYAQCFDELIRQVTLNCAERGALLTRVRDELRMTVGAYQTLYESSIAFGIRKALEAEQGKSELEARVAQLEGEKKELEQQVAELKSKCDFIEKRENERRAQEEKKHSEEVAFLKRTNIQLKTQLESILKK